MEPDNRPAHSPLGASSAERWMNCPGSVALLQKLELPSSDEVDYQREGTAAHAAAASLLVSGQDAWEVIGQEFEGQIVSEGMANAIQIYKDFCTGLQTAGASLPPNKRWLKADGPTVWIEEHIYEPGIHKDYYGTVDYGCLRFQHDDLSDALTLTLDIVDYKHGEGIFVDVERNVQVMYYAFGLISRIAPDLLPELRVRLWIVQPRIHWAEPIRCWETTADVIVDWVNDELVPAMDRAEIDHSLDCGEWCRFCPAKLICPKLSGLFEAAAKTDPNTIVNLSDSRLGLEYQQIQGVKFYLKALEEETFRRLNAGRAIDGTKLVPKKARRVFKDGAEEAFSDRFGDDAFTKRELKSPAEMEKIGTGAADLVKEWAYTPKTGLTVALASDHRSGVKVKKTEELFNLEGLING